MIELTQENFIANAIQSIKDLINGGLTHRNMKTFRTFFVINAMDSLDSDVPMYVPFAIPASTAEVVEVRVNFWLLPFRAYSKAAASGGGHTTPSGGGSTSGSGGGQTSSSGGGQTVTSNSVAGNHHHAIAINTGSYGSTVTFYGGALYCSSGGTADTGSPSSSHSHSVTISNHTHTVSDHVHSTPNHTHTVSDHSHDITFGIYEEDNSPSVTLYVSRDGGATYPTRVGTYSTDQIGIEITSYVDTPGSKMLKFESTDLGRLSVQIEIKVDMSR